MAHWCHRLKSGTTLTARYGRELARDLFQASLAAVDAVEEVVKVEGIDCTSSAWHWRLLEAGAYQRFEASRGARTDFDHKVAWCRAPNWP